MTNSKSIPQANYQSVNASSKLAKPLKMSIGKSGKNLAFVQDDSGDSNEPVYKNSDDSNEPVHKDSEDNVSVSKQAGPEPHPAISNPLFKGKNITARGYILIISLAATIFAGRKSESIDSLGCRCEKLIIIRL